MPPKSFNEGQHIMSIEDVDIKVKYTLTISPNDDYQYFNHKSSDREKNFRESFEEFFTMVDFQGINIYLHPELSPRGRLHFHGTILFKTEKAIKLFYMDAIHVMLRRSQIEMDTIKDAEVWDTYCKKQSKYFDWVIDNTKDYKMKRLHKSKDDGVTYKTFNSYITP